jgi:hypothetical protein
VTQTDFRESFLLMKFKVSPFVLFILSFSPSLFFEGERNRKKTIIGDLLLLYTTPPHINPFAKDKPTKIIFLRTQFSVRNNKFNFVRLIAIHSNFGILDNINY